MRKEHENSLYQEQEQETTLFENQEEKNVWLLFEEKTTFVCLYLETFAPFLLSVFSSLSICIVLRTKQPLQDVHRQRDLRRKGCEENSEKREKSIFLCIELILFFSNTFEGLLRVFTTSAKKL